MFCLDRKVLVKKPSVWAEWHTPRVGLRIGKAAYHLEVGEALALANRLVDTVELIEARQEKQE